MIAVIGDGSMTAGLAYEGLNQAGYTHKDKNLIVILNDNEMSISRNVGALSSFISRAFSKKNYRISAKSSVISLNRSRNLVTIYTNLPNEPKNL